MKRYRIITLIIIILCLGYCTQSDFHERKEFPVTVVAKGDTSSGGKYPSGKFIFAVKDDNGIGYDEQVSFHSWNEFNIGDRILISRSNQELKNYSLFRDIFDFLITLTFMFAVLIFVMVEISELIFSKMKK